MSAEARDDEARAEDHDVAKHLRSMIRRCHEEALEMKREIHAPTRAQAARWMQLSLDVHALEHALSKF